MASYDRTFRDAAWREMPLAQKIGLATGLADALRSARSEFVELSAREMGLLRQIRLGLNSSVEFLSSAVPGVPETQAR